MESLAGRRTWTRELLADLIGVGSVSYRDGSSRALDVPPGLRDVGEIDDEAFVSWADLGDRLFPGDLGNLARAWRGAKDRPGLPAIARARHRRSFAWWECEYTYLDLRDDPSVGAIVCIRQDIGPVPAPPPSARIDAEGASASSPVWLLRHMDEFGRVDRCEGFALEVLGVDCHELIGTHALDDIHPDDHDLIVSTWIELLGDPGATRTAIARVRNRTGIYRWYETMMTNRLDDPEVRAIVSIGYDIEDRRRNESALRASERQFRALAEEMPVAVFRADPLGRITYANDLFRATIGDIGRLDQLGVALEDWWHEVLDSDRSVEQLFEVDHVTFRIRGRAQRSDAEVDSIRRCQLDAVIGSVEDVTAAVTRERYLHELAHSDPLTGLANRRVLEQVLEQTLAHEERVLVIVTDLDGFKALNDRAGHQVGDEVLVEVARRLLAAVRPDDLVARMGGDEFVVVCRCVSDEAAADLVGRVRTSITRPFPQGGGLAVEVSVGSARSLPGDLPATVLRRADIAMYEDKRRGPAGR